MSIQEISVAQLDAVTGGQQINGYEGASAVIATLGLGALMVTLGPITLGIGAGAAGGLALAEFLARLELRHK